MNEFRKLYEEYKNTRPSKTPLEKLVVSLLAWGFALVDAIAGSIIAFWILPWDLKHFTSLPASARVWVHWAQLGVDGLWILAIVVLVWLFVRYFWAIKQQRGAIV